ATYGRSAPRPRRRSYAGIPSSRSLSLAPSLRAAGSRLSCRLVFRLRRSSPPCVGCAGRGSSSESASQPFTARRCGGAETGWGIKTLLQPCAAVQNLQAQLFGIGEEVSQFLSERIMANYNLAVGTKGYAAIGCVRLFEK